MFFTRLAVAALSLSSATRVFGAPVQSNRTLPESPSDGLNRRDVTFVVDLNDAQSALVTIKTQVDGMVKNSGATVADKLASTLEGVTQIFSHLNEKLKADGKDKASLMLDSDGVTKLTPEAFGAKVKAVLEPVNGILSDIKKSSSLKTLGPSVNHIKAEVTAFDSNIKFFLPVISDVVGGIFGAVFGVIGGIVGAIGDLLGGGGDGGDGDNGGDDGGNGEELLRAGIRLLNRI